MDLGLRGRAAFVAASSKGMGRAIAEQFAAEGADVGMCARSEADVADRCEAVRTHGGRVVATVGGRCRPEQTRIAVERTVTNSDGSTHSLSTPVARRGIPLRTWTMRSSTQPINSRS